MGAPRIWETTAIWAQTGVMAMPETDFRKLCRLCSYIHHVISPTSVRTNRQCQINNITTKSTCARIIGAPRPACTRVVFQLLYQARLLYSNPATDCCYLIDCWTWRPRRRFQPQILWWVSRGTVKNSYIHSITVWELRSYQFYAGNFGRTLWAGMIEDQTHQ